MDTFVSVIVPVFNDKDNLKVCLRSLFDTSFSGFEVIVVDDGSSESLESATKGFPCRFIRLPQNMGQAYARNVAAQESKGSILIFTDADCRPMKDWVKIMVDELEKSRREYGNTAAVIGRVISGNGFFESCHSYTGYAYIQNGPRRPMEYLNTACVAVYKEAFLSVEGFSADMRVSEDPELALKLAEAGYRVVFEPSIFVFHNHGVCTFRQFIKKHFNWGKTIGLKLELKHRRRLGAFTPLLLNPLGNFLIILPLSLITALKIVKCNVQYDKKVLLYFFFIFIGKVSFRSGIFFNSLENKHG